jgi:hypothetical protein
MFQALEAGMVAPLVGQTVTASVLVRANATWAAISGQSLNMIISKNSTPNTLSGTWTQIATAGISAASIPTGTSSSNWLKLSTTFTIPNDGTAAGIRFQVAEAAVGPSGAYWELAQAQLETGSVATAFTTATGTVQGELAACQRYYYRTATGVAYHTYGLGYGKSSTVAQIQTQLPVTMRVSPTSLDYSGLATYDGASVLGISSASLGGLASTPNIAFIEVVGTITQYRPYSLTNNNLTSGYVGFNAEL